jgi:hypothetical protein
MTIAKTNGNRAEMLDFLRRNYPDSGSRVCDNHTLSAYRRSPVVQGQEYCFWCLQWDSNPHFDDFKSSASAIGLWRLKRKGTPCGIPFRLAFD